MKRREPVASDYELGEVERGWAVMWTPGVLSRTVPPVHYKRDGEALGGGRGRCRRARSGSGRVVWASTRRRRSSGRMTVFRVGGVVGVRRRGRSGETLRRSRAERSSCLGRRSLRVERGHPELCVAAQECRGVAHCGT